ncbi:restriction endonuclease [Parasphingorhabdus flavimaris]|uniref:Restriction endonuclease n=1 Tax=Parasphingorhabdus flavimaris TaxID=266812 RepID=A0ABX2MZB8_9SPHN|nr:type II restriction endonuclease [Parasphingorhabdus flavimaris]NVD26778.1 restriction endonuclease [Parasphingorhabdus flavimaris]
MNKGYLSGYFEGIGSKILTRVDATSKSNQHEVGDVDQGKALMRILGSTPRKGANRFRARYIWLADEQESICEEGYLSWYDTRANQPKRSSEWRLYYQTNAVTELMKERDRLFVARQKDDYLLFIVVPESSSITNQLAWLFGLDIQQSFEGFSVQTISGSQDTELDFISRFILDELGIEFEDPNANSLDTIIERFGMAFPSTADFSDLARLTLPEVNSRDDPDIALMAWLDHEEAMFRRLENKIVAKRVSEGFLDGDQVDVDGFIKYSLSVQNRRKSRMGRSLENHLRVIFDEFEINYDAQVITEKGKKPDFIFPGKVEYFNPSFSTSLLTMLAAKSTCKDRWPQILPEAERISKKHLLTLELGISEPQTQMMMDSNVQLVIPKRIHSSYTEKQINSLWCLQDFLSEIETRQRQIENL